MRPDSKRPGPGLPASLFIAAILAAGVPQVAADDSPAIIAALRAAGATVMPLGNDGGLPGWMIDPTDGPAYTAYTTPAGGTVVGLMYDREGTLLTGQQLTRAGIESPVGADPTAPPTDTPDIEALFRAARDAFGFVIGPTIPETVSDQQEASRPVVHVFADPRCPYSRQHLAVLGEAAAADLLRVHVIPVAILGRASATRAALVAGAADPAAAWNGTAETSATTDLATGARRISDNNALHRAWRARGVPFTIYRQPGHEPKGGHIRVTYGAVDNANRFIGGDDTAGGSQGVSGPMPAHGSQVVGGGHP